MSFFLSVLSSCSFLLELILLMPSSLVSCSWPVMLRFMPVRAKIQTTVLLANRSAGGVSSVMSHMFSAMVTIRNPKLLWAWSLITSGLSPVSEHRPLFLPTCHCHDHLCKQCGLFCSLAFFFAPFRSHNHWQAHLSIRRSWIWTISSTFSEFNTRRK